MTTKMSDDEIALGRGEVLQQLASARAKFKEEREAADTKVAERLRNLMSTCFDGSRSGNLAFQLADMEEWIPKFTSEWKANHRRWLELCTRLGRDALDLEQRGRVAEVDAIAGEALELKRIRSIVDEDARKRHGDREGEPSWGVIADCVLAHVSQHRQAREILDVPEQFTLDQYVSILGAEAQQANEIVEVRQVLEAMLGRTPDPARSTSQLAREVVVQAERWQGECASLQEFNRAHIRDRERACAVRDVAVERHRVLEQSVAETNQYLRDFETGLVNAGKWDTHPELPLNLLAREVVAQAERWRIDAEYYQGEVAATRAEAKRQIAALERRASGRSRRRSSAS